MCYNTSKPTKPSMPKVKDENSRALELHDDFTLEFDKTLEALIDTYPRHSRVKKNKDLTENVFKMVIYTAMLNTLRELQVDSAKLTMREFHKKYVPNLPILYRCDFTSEEFKKIIDDSYLTGRDKNIAYQFFVEKKNSNDIYIDLELDKKTVDNNLPDINDALLYRACIFNKESK